MPHSGSKRCPNRRASRRSYLRIIDSCITQLKAQEPSRTCNESKEEEEEASREGACRQGHGSVLRRETGSKKVVGAEFMVQDLGFRGSGNHLLSGSGVSKLGFSGQRNVQRFRGGLVSKADRLVYHSTLGLSVITKQKKLEFIGPASRVKGPHGGLRPFHQKSTCLMQLALGPDVVQIWSRNPHKIEATNPSKSTVGGQDAGRVSREALRPGNLTFDKRSLVHCVARFVEVHLVAVRNAENAHQRKSSLLTTYWSESTSSS